MSKFKPVATDNLPAELLAYLDTEDFARALLSEVLSATLNVDDIFNRPAEHYVQKHDPAISVNGHRGIELTLSKISVGDGRYFGKALEAMQEVLSWVIMRFVPRGEHVQIFCVISTDAPVYGTSSTLFEMEKAVWIEGGA
jgi:hypothetical protein